MPKVSAESPIHFGRNFGELWRNGQVCCEDLQAVAVSCGNQRPMHKLIFDVQHGKFVFIYDDGRSKILGTLPGTATLEDIVRLQELLQKAEARALEADRGYGVIVKQLEKMKFEGNLQAEAKKEIETELKETKKELVAEKIAREKAEKTARDAEKKVSGLEAQVAVLERRLKSDAGEMRSRGQASATLMAKRDEQLEVLKVQKTTLAENCERSQAKVAELTRANKKIRNELGEKVNLCEELSERVTEVLLESEIQQNEAETVKNDLQAKIDELRQPRAMEVMAVATQTEAAPETEQEHRFETYDNVVESATQTEAGPEMALTDAGPETAFTDVERRRLEAEVQMLENERELRLRELDYMRMIIAKKKSNEEQQHLIDAAYAHGYDDGQAKGSRNIDWAGKKRNGMVHASKKKCPIRHTARGRGK